MGWCATSGMMFVALCYLNGLAKARVLVSLAWLCFSRSQLRQL